MMFHPSKSNWWVRGALAAQPLTITFHGRSSHAAAAPEKGINALNALLLTYHAIDSLRQHVTSDVRIHGVITHGGDAANVVPALAQGEFLVRANAQSALVGLRSIRGAGPALRGGGGRRHRRARRDENGLGVRRAQQQPRARGTVWRQHARARRRRRRAVRVRGRRIVRHRQRQPRRADDSSLSLDHGRRGRARPSFARPRRPSAGTPRC